MMRIGYGLDVHSLAEGRALVLCGVHVPHEKGLLGYSDADVATHALMDALLGAVALGDIGKLFPDTDVQYKGISSMILLDEVMRQVADTGFKPVNIDITIAAQRPKLRPYVDTMRAVLAEHLGLAVDCVSVKATTTEHLGFEGEEKGISAHAVCLLESIQ
ncbi:MAG TPA: 2-C-methyl-D-erythritol 2,4-cyclodiphosphate synthase [Candidatus Limiplasma sp.]|nr:2-C-methyl-D-erythritol 2,4-cyclodiphosphate synthase [Candidatus Limiplasma sp.]